MKDTGQQKQNRKRFSISGTTLFLIIVLAIYTVLLIAVPEKGISAILETGKIFRNILWPILAVLGVMFFFNLFIHPGKIVRLVGTKSGFKGMVLAAAAGIISMGPIYAWFPFLKEMREKGAGVRPVTMFMACRAIKPVLLPVMVSYFGLLYSLILTLFIFTGALIQAMLMGIVNRK